jgi:hypothetical protein
MIAAAIVGVWQKRIILSPIAFLIQASWAPLSVVAVGAAVGAVGAAAAIGLQEESQGTDDEDEEGQGHEAHA